MVKSLSGLSSSNVYVNTVASGTAIELISSNSTLVNINLNMKLNTTERTIPNSDDFRLTFLS